MILKRMKSASTFVLVSVVLCIVIHDVVGGSTDRVERAEFVDLTNERVEKTKDFRWQLVEFKCEMKRKQFG
jgi:hypothetical protein